jgi:hypothetical protein
LPADARLWRPFTKRSPPVERAWATPQLGGEFFSALIFGKDWFGTRHGHLMHVITRAQNDIPSLLVIRQIQKNLFVLWDKSLRRNLSALLPVRNGLFRAKILYVFLNVIPGLKEPSQTLLRCLERFLMQGT